MIINKFQGKTEEEATEKARAEMGGSVVIMNVREIKPKGLFRTFKSSTYEVTAAKEEKEQYVNAQPAVKAPLKQHENINYAADEKIQLPIREKHALEVPRVAVPQTVTDAIQSGIKERELEEKLESLQNMLEKNLQGENTNATIKFSADTTGQSEGFRCMKMIYEKLLENEVDEKYVNQIMDDVERVIRTSSSMDVVLSSVYQKMILKFGQPAGIELPPVQGQPKIIFFIGPTGVGKTTTIAKIASKFKVDMGRKVAFMTADTYRIAAAEQLRIYANILNTPLSIIYSADELDAAIGCVQDHDLVLVDTAGFSHKNKEQRENVTQLVESVDGKYEKEVYLVLSATTKYRDLLDIVDIYKDISDYKIIFTKLDETTTYGNLLNVRMYSGAELSYVTTGQNVPDDMEIFDTQKVVKQLLGGR